MSQSVEKNLFWYCAVWKQDWNVVIAVIKHCILLLHNLLVLTHVCKLHQASHLAYLSTPSTSISIQFDKSNGDPWHHNQNITN